MDYGIRGRKAIVCASSQGLGGAAPSPSRAKASTLVVNARSRDRLESDRRGDPPETGVRSPPWPRHHHARRPGRGARCLPRARHAGQQCRRPAARRLPRLGRGHAGRTAVNGNMITPIMLIRSVVDGMIERRFGRIVNITSRSVKIAAPRPRIVDRRPGRAHGLRREPVAAGRQAQRHDQQPAAGAVRHRAHDRRAEEALGEGRTGLRDVLGGAPRGSAGRALRHARRNSARPARSCAAPTPASSSARTC